MDFEIYKLDVTLEPELYEKVAKLINKIKKATTQSRGYFDLGMRKQCLDCFDFFYDVEFKKEADRVDKAFRKATELPDDFPTPIQIVMMGIPPLLAEIKKKWQEQDAKRVSLN